MNVPYDEELVVVVHPLIAVENATDRSVSVEVTEKVLSFVFDMVRDCSDILIALVMVSDSTIEQNSFFAFGD